MRACSTDFRREVLAACDAGGTTRPMAQRFGTSESWAAASSKSVGSKVGLHRCSRDAG